MKVDLALRHDSDVGEGPIWDPENRELIWVDVTKGYIHSWNLNSGSLHSLSLGLHIGAVGLHSDSSLVAAVRDGFAIVDRESGNMEYLASVLQDQETRFNDGKCDPLGRFVAGTMRYQPSPATAALYSCDATGRVKTILGEVGLSNGLCWDEKGETVFFIDTLTGSISRFDYDLESGELHNRTTFFSFKESDGSPDGMTIDAEGNLWVALWAGAKVVRIDASGRLVQEIPLPVSQPTSVTFGGENLDQLFITSARYQLSSSQLESQPLAGSIFVIDLDVAGREEPRFGKGMSTAVN